MTHINQRRDYANNWAYANPVLQAGEVGWEIDTRKSKLGDGVTKWNDLPYTVSVLSVTKADVGLGNVDNTSDLDKPVSSATQAAISAAVAAAVQQALDRAHPVGSIYTSLDPTDPSTLFGGTWVPWAQGEMVVGVKPGDTRFDTPDEHGGSDTIKDENLPNHTHGMDHDHPSASTGNNSVGHTHPGPSHQHGFRYAARGTYTLGGSGAGVFGIQSAADTTSVATDAGGGQTLGENTPHTHSFDVPAYTGSTGNKNGTASTPFRSPYVTAYMWKRTA